MSEIDPEIAERLKRHAHSVVVSPDLPERIVHQARTRRRRHGAALLGVPAALVVALLIAVAVVLPGGSRTTRPEATAGPAVHGAASKTNASAAGAAPPVLLTPTGVGTAHFSEATNRAIAHLKAILGRPGTARPQSENSCDVTSSLVWRGFTAFFDHGHFVGYDSTRQSLSTANGLHSGDTVAAAKTIYGRAFHLSMAQGGSYRITLSSGELTGYVHGGVTAPSHPPPAEVDGIDAGATGCPGISP
jgi:hypothetical protein